MAGFTPQQQQAFQQYGALQGTAQPYYNQASNLYAQAGAPLSQATINQFYQPAVAGVTSQLQNLYGQQNSQNTANLVQSAGGIGADRIAVGQGNLANQQDLAAGQTFSNIYAQAVSQAQAQQAQEANVGNAYTNLGTTALNAGLQGTGALLQSGTIQQQQNQAALNAQYQNQLAQIAYPFQTAQYLAGITGGLSGALGGTTNQFGSQVTTPPTPSWLNQVVGVGTAGAGLYGAINGSNNGTLQYSPESGIYSTGTSASADALQDQLQDLGYDRGGIVGYAPGGGVNNSAEEDIPGLQGAGSSPIPYIPMQAGSGHSGLTTGQISPMSNPQQQSQSSQQGDSVGTDIANVAKVASTIIPLLRQGGTVKGYDDGGNVNTPDSPNFDPSRPIEGTSAPIGWPWPFNSAHTVMGGRGEMVPYPPPEPPGPIFRPGSLADRAANYLSPSSSGTIDHSPATGPIATIAPVTGSDREVNPNPVSPGTIPVPQPYPGPGALGSNPNAVPLNPSAKPTADDDDDTDVPAPAPQYIPSHPDVASIPVPYPDNLQRDVGQTMTRSPWMALVNAGATIASTPGPLGSAIGKGILAGTKSLEDERKELRSEQQLNDKARELAEKAKEHLDKYNNMTPYERGSLAARNKEISQENAGVPGKPGKFTGADYDRAAKFVQSMYPGLSPEQLQPLIEAEVARRRHALAMGTSAASVPAGPTINTAPAAAPTVVQNGHTYTLQPDGTYK